MSNSWNYPKIMESGELSRLNQEIIDKLGTPVFFSTPEPSRPRATSPSGILYEVVTGLYMIYHDYGIQILDSYCRFCKARNMPWAGPALSHIKSVSNLRGGLCHGSCEQGHHASTFIRTLQYYFPQESGLLWPSFPSGLTENQCLHLLNKVVENSNRFTRHLLFWATEISNNPTLLQLWRMELKEKALNKDLQVYGKGSSYFDQRIVNDLALACKGSGELKPYGITLQKWLTDLEPQILHGSFTSTKDLSDSLFDAINELYNPVTTLTTQSSADMILSGLL